MSGIRRRKGERRMRKGEPTSSFVGALRIVLNIRIILSDIYISKKRY